MPFTDIATGFSITSIADPTTTIAFTFSDATPTLLARA